MSEPTVSEDALNKALEALEASVLKGDALQELDPEGGFATEGKALSDKVVKTLVDGGIPLEKAQKMAKNAMEYDDDEEEGGDDEGEGEGCPPAASKGMKKSAVDRGAANLSSAVATDAVQLKKALTNDNPDDANVVDVTEFVEGLIDSTTRAVGTMEESVNALRKSVTDSEEKSSVMDTRIAKAFVAISNGMKALTAKVDALADQPVISRTPMTLKKSDVIDPQFRGGTPSIANPEGDPSALHEVEFLKIQESLVKKAMAGEIDIMAVTNFEQSGNFNSLPQNIIKSLESELCR